VSALRILAAPLNVRNPDTLVRGCAAGKADRNVRVTNMGCAALTCVTRTLLSAFYQRRIQAPAQLFFDVVAKNGRITCETSLLEHFGHLTFLVSRSLIRIKALNFFLHLLQTKS
jgi:hypothetical protein